MLQVAKFKSETRILIQSLLCYLRYFTLKKYSFLNLASPIKIFRNGMYYPQTKVNLDSSNT